MALIGVSYGGGPIARWLATQPRAIGCIEVTAEDFYQRGRPYLASLAALYPVVVRALSLSIGTPGPLHRERLRWLTEVVAIADSPYVVVPLGFNHTDEIKLSRSIPISLNSRSLAVVAEHVLLLSELCGKPILVQNIAAAIRVRGTIAETDFLNRLCQETGCRLLVDITGLLVASRNHRCNPLTWLGDLDGDLVGGAHIGACCFRNGRWDDAHQGIIDEEAWSLIGRLLQCGRPDLLILEVQRASDGIERLQQDGERLRLLDATMRQETDTICRVPPSTGVKRRRPKSVSQQVTAVAPTVETATTASDWSEHVDIAADACLYVLDREGVFFSESRQEIYLFNTTATLIWCLLEQGLSLNAVADAFRHAYGMSHSEATTHVAVILRQWFGLGCILNPGLSTAPEIPLTTALAWLLTNPQLRVQFKASPRKTAALLRVELADFGSFVTLDPDELDAQAAEIAELRSVSRSAGAVGGTKASPVTNVVIDPDLLRVALRVRHVQPARARYYRLLNTTFCIHFPGMDSLDANLHAALAHLDVAEQTPDVTLEIADGDGGWMVLDGPMPVRYCRCADDVVPAVKQMLREISVDRFRYLIKIHAGVVFFGSACVLLPGAAGSGKTTLTAALVRSGVKYFSDEVALLEEDTLGVRPVPLAMTIKTGSVEPLRALYPHLAELAQHMREDHHRVQYLPPPPESLFDDGQAHQVRWIVFPRYDPNVETALVPLDRPQGLRRLLDESLVLPDLLDRGKVESLVHWMRGVQCFELPMSSLATGVALVRSLTEEPAGLFK